MTNLIPEISSKVTILSLSIIKRIRKIIFAALGMIIFQIEKARTGTDSHD